MEFKQIDVLYDNISYGFSGKDNSVRITKIRFCVKGNYFYVLIFYIKCCLWIRLIFQQKNIYSL